MSAVSLNQHYLRTALSLAYCSRAAYRDDPEDDAMFAKFGWKISRTFEHRPSHTQGFVAADDESVVVSFRGTEQNIEDWITDLSYRHHSRRVLGGRIHRGFWKSWTAVKSKALDSIASVRTSRQRLWVTGHSLGGALATLAGRDMPRFLRPTGVVTFGAPRVGDPSFAQNYNAPHARYVNEDDVVPHVPFRGLINRYEHVGNGRIMLSNGSITGSATAWRRLLRSVGKIMVFGTDFLPSKSFRDHSLDEYIAKLVKHRANQNHPLLRD